MKPLLTSPRVTAQQSSSQRGNGALQPTPSPAMLQNQAEDQPHCVHVILFPP
ncbi:hypothetical protein Nmel_003682 [Mimus melanotis]